MQLRLRSEATRVEFFHFMLCFFPNIWASISCWDRIVTMLPFVPSARLMEFGTDTTILAIVSSSWLLRTVLYYPIGHNAVTMGGLSASDIR